MTRRRDRRRFGRGPYVLGGRALEPVLAATKPRNGYFLRAESFFNVASFVDSDGIFAPDLSLYGDLPLHQQSHGQSFLALAGNRFGGEGLYILDEPEAALSVSGALALVGVIVRAARTGAQFVIATHSPVLLACPEHGSTSSTARDSRRARTTISRPCGSRAASWTRPSAFYVRCSRTVSRLADPAPNRERPSCVCRGSPQTLGEGANVSTTLRRCLIASVAVLCGLAVPASAAAAVETFHRFEAVATAYYTVTVQCPDGSTAETLVTVIGGHEEESEAGTTTLDSDFLTVLIRGFDCARDLVNDRGSGAAEFAFSPSLQTASVAGTITTRDGSSVTVDVTWEGTGAVESTSNTTTFPGVTGHFKGKRRDAVATGTVVVDGDTLVDGSTTNAEIETLEDKNITHG